MLPKIYSLLFSGNGQVDVSAGALYMTGQSPKLGVPLLFTVAGIYLDRHGEMFAGQVLDNCGIELL